MGEIKGHYLRSVISPTTLAFGNLKTYQHVAPLFEMLARVDFRPVRHLSLGPFYGLRNGTLAAGIAVRFHLVK